MRARWDALSRCVGPVLLLVVALIGDTRVASAQAVLNPTPPLFDVTVGGGVLAGAAIGDVDADLRSSRLTPSAFRLFATDTTIGPSPLFEVRAAASVTRRVAVEGQVHLARPELRTVISDDAEAAADLTVTERLTDLLAAGGVRIRLDDPRRQARTMPHVSGGAGVLRQTHEDGTQVGQKPVLYVGGGVRHAFTVGPAGFPRSGLRADVQLFLGKSGLRSDDSMMSQLAVTGGLFFSF